MVGGWGGVIRIFIGESLDCIIDDVLIRVVGVIYLFYFICQIYVVFLIDVFVEFYLSDLQ